ncbi:MAG: hypothetical protein ACFFFH_16415 [Candidatus Thorarchaeota archaeon]
MRTRKMKQFSIHDYLGLGYQAKTWFLEFDVGDFKAPIAKLLQLPQEIYQSRKKTFFLAFMNSFLQTCEVSFILRKPRLDDPKIDRIELALLGSWEGRQHAIPLWILKDLLLGFEVISSEQYEILDSEPLTWLQQKTTTSKQKISLSLDPNLIILDDDFFQGEKIYFKLEDNTITISRYFNEMEFFDRIARASIPEIDELDDI